jgi:glycosyltransferase involved in cell wall biosynthesis
MDKKNTFFTINTFQTLPPFYQLINSLFSDEKEDVLLIHNTINGFENQVLNSNFNEIFIIHFQSLFQFQNQFIFIKVWKYFKLIKLFLSYISFNNHSNRIFTFDIFTTYLAVKLKRKNTKVIYVQYEMIEEKQLNRLDKFLFKQIINQQNKIDLIITPEINRTNFLMSQLKSDNSEKFFTLPNTNNNQVELILESDINRPIIVTHIGAVGLDHNIKAFMNAIKICDSEKFEFRFIGSLHEDVEKLILSYNLKNVKIFGQIPHDNLKSHYIETDIGVILYKDNGLNYRFCAPNKLYEYWSFGIPVIGDTLPSLKSVFNHECLGRLVDMSEIDSFSEAILELSNKINKIKVQSYFNQNFKLDIFSNSLKIKIDKL